MNEHFEKRTVTVVEFARLAGISRTTAYECVRSRAIPSVRFGRRIVVPKWAVESALGKGQPTANKREPSTR